MVFIAKQGQTGLVSETEPELNAALLAEYIARISIIYGVCFGFGIDVNQTKFVI